jgi:hypothetical protein
MKRRGLVINPQNMQAINIVVFAQQALRLCIKSCSAKRQVAHAASADILFVFTVGQHGCLGQEHVFARVATANDRSGRLDWGAMFVLYEVHRGYARVPFVDFILTPMREAFVQPVVSRSGVFESVTAGALVIMSENRLAGHL